MSDPKYRVATDVIEEQQHLRAELQRYREAALIAYGAILARNADGDSDALIAILDRYLSPDLSAQTDPTED